jgi:hypothetical protein
MLAKYILILVGIFGGLTALAAPHRALDKKINSYVKEGLVVGGQAGTAYSLLRVRRDLSEKLGMERIILDLGDAEGRPLRGIVSYFQASVEKSPPRLVLDLAQLSRSGVNESTLRKIFSTSPYVRRVELTADPEDHSASLTFAFKQPMAVEVFSMPSRTKASRIVIDIKTLDKKASSIQ